ncbi:Protein of unknown function [Salinihabitans flavidus]|uniref:Inner membrane protein YgaP-like transmembrane domain-containing protein n=2 Tax=Salinihabitans flavidus TaxID=569882 RepID=A0A1H8RYU0_9RHOB|nr:Protein of unknown function [Salinihabitans flavidus]
MTANVGNIDRVIRLIVGIVLVVLPIFTTSTIWANPVIAYGAVIIGLVLIVTSALKFCPLYRILGMSTCQR